MSQARCPLQARARFWFGALGVHQAPQARGDIPIGVVEARQVTVDRGGLRRTAALLQLVAEGVQITQHGGTGFAALEFGKALFEVVEEPCGIGADGSAESWVRVGAAVEAAKRDHSSNALPAAQ